MAKNSYYFPHDYNARGDEDLVKLRANMDWQGVGLYWAIIEKLHENGGVLSRDYNLLAYDLKAEPELIKKMVEEFDLFILNEKNFENERVNRNLKAQEQKSKKAQKSANRRWKNGDANAMRTHSEGNAIKEKKGEEINKNKYKYIESEDFSKLWDDYLDMRKQNKKYPTKQAQLIALEKLHKWPIETACRMLENSILNNWTGIFPVREDQKSNSKVIDLRE